MLGAPGDAILRPPAAAALDWDGDTVVLSIDGADPRTDLVYGLAYIENADLEFEWAILLPTADEVRFALPDLTGLDGAPVFPVDESVIYGMDLYQRDAHDADGFIGYLDRYGANLPADADLADEDGLFRQTYRWYGD